MDARNHEFLTTAPLSRRRAMQLAGGTFGLNLPSLWQAQLGHAASPSSDLRRASASPIKACIVVFYYGGPSHLDTYDLKPNAPAEIRGEFQPIATSAPGIMISEHLPKMSRVMHKVALIQSMHHGNRLHDSASTEALTGRPSLNGDREELAPIEQFIRVWSVSVTSGRTDTSRFLMRHCRSCFTMLSTLLARAEDFWGRVSIRCRFHWISNRSLIEPAH